MFIDNPGADVEKQAIKAEAADASAGERIVDVVRHALDDLDLSLVECGAPPTPEGTRVWSERAAKLLGGDQPDLTIARAAVNSIRQAEVELAQAKARARAIVRRAELRLEIATAVLRPAVEEWAKRWRSKLCKPKQKRISLGEAGAPPFLQFRDFNTPVLERTDRERATRFVLDRFGVSRSYIDKLIVVTEEVSAARVRDEIERELEDEISKEVLERSAARDGEVLPDEEQLAIRDRIAQRIYREVEASGGFSVKPAGERLILMYGKKEGEDER